MTKEISLNNDKKGSRRAGDYQERERIQIMISKIKRTNFITSRTHWISGHLLINFERLSKIQVMSLNDDQSLLEWLWDLILLCLSRKGVKNYHHVQSYYCPIVKVFYKFIISFTKLYHRSVEHLK